MATYANIQTNLHEQREVLHLIDGYLYFNVPTDRAAFVVSTKKRDICFGSA